jgi:hypothetical protein
MSTLTISHKNIWLRVFLWAWEVNPDKLNICKLLWGTVFLPVGIIFVKESKRPFYFLSPAAAIWLSCLFVPSLCFGAYTFAFTVFLFVLCSLAYNYVRRDAIARKCDRQEAKATALKASGHPFGELTESILDKIFAPLIWLIVFMVETAERFSWTNPGGRITGFFSLCYHFVKSTKQKTCLFVKVE